MATTRVQTALKFFSTFENHSIGTLEDILTPDFQHFYAPASPPRPPIDKATYTAHMSQMKEILHGFPVIVKEISQDVDKNQVVIWANGHAKFRKEVMEVEDTDEDWKFEGEYIFILSMDANGERIKRVIEFVDSKGTDRLRELIRKARSRREI